MQRVLQPWKSKTRAPQASPHAAKTTQASVAADHVFGGRIAVDHLIGQGRRRLGFVSADLDNLRVQDQLRGAVLALSSAPGVALEVIRTTSGALDAGVACAEAIAQRPQAERPDGLFCTNQILAIGASRVFAAGYSRRESMDVAIVGYDAPEMTSLAAVPVTAVRIPYQEMGAAAVNLLFESISQIQQEGSASGASTRSHVRLNPEIVSLVSTA
ncbi:substrate-binding domain-containing protein [Streptomyces sp. NPDC058691]|uniref:substrate-binding domain-containing protein n=1 Tax=Streptomyces sp. NPDC058691 TaxID=3346601 RepID=UPI003662D695